MKKRLFSKVAYLIILACGTVCIVLSETALKVTLGNVFLSIGTGLFSSGITAGLIDLTCYLEFAKQRKYRRALELSRLSFHMKEIACLIIGENDNKNVRDIIDKLSITVISDENIDNIRMIINSHRVFIEKELQTIRKVQDYLSLSGFFDDQEIAFLARSVNYYQKDLTKESLRTILKNVINYLKRFSDIVCSK